MALGQSTRCPHLKKRSSRHRLADSGRWPRSQASHTVLGPALPCCGTVVCRLGSLSRLNSAEAQVPFPHCPAGLGDPCVLPPCCPQSVSTPTHPSPGPGCVHVLDLWKSPGLCFQNGGLASQGVSAGGGLGGLAHRNTRSAVGRAQEPPGTGTEDNVQVKRGTVDRVGAVPGL